MLKKNTQSNGAVISCKPPQLSLFLLRDKHPFLKCSHLIEPWLHQFSNCVTQGVAVLDDAVSETRGSLTSEFLPPMRWTRGSFFQTSAFRSLLESLVHQEACVFTLLPQILALRLALLPLLNFVMTSDLTNFTCMFYLSSFSVMLVFFFFIHTSAFNMLFYNLR